MKERCNFCYRHCLIDEGKQGFCGVRENKGGAIRSLHYACLVSLGIDPIEKKPLYHFLPGSQSLSLAEQGCNYTCQFCQNYEISQKEYACQTVFVDPVKVVSLAKEQGAASISFTYSEPLVWQDYLIDCATLAKQKGVLTVMVSNGSFSKEARERIIPLVDAFNIDVKGDKQFYQAVCNASLDPVLEGIEAIVQAGKHLEVTTLLIEGLHTMETVEFLGKQLKERGVQVWHLSRFFPRYKMETRKATSETFLEDALAVARESGIPYIYGGNSTHVDSTFCPRCHRLLIRDHQYGGTQGQEAKETISQGRCKFCNQTIYGLFV